LTLNTLKGSNNLKKDGLGLTMGSGGGNTQGLIENNLRAVGFYFESALQVRAGFQF
jgi:hypothetical protein